jgi:DNA-binding transcriptional ArsR family regulator
MAAGDIARTVGALPNTLSTNLNILSHAGLVAARRDGRSIIYTADYDRMSLLLAFLMEDCCGGKPEICAPLVAIASQCCEAEGRCA